MKAVIVLLLNHSEKQLMGTECVTHTFIHVLLLVL